MSTLQTIAPAGETSMTRLSPVSAIKVLPSGSRVALLGLFNITPESDPSIESVHVVDVEGEIFRQLFFLEGRLVGGVLIGADLSRKFYKDLIRSREVVPSSQWEKLLHPPAPARARVGAAD